MGVCCRWCGWRRRLDDWFRRGAGQSTAKGPPLDDVTPEGRFLGGQQGVLAGVPAEEVGSADVGAVIVAAGPDFVDHIGPRLISGGVKIVLQTACLLAGGTGKSAKLGLQKELLGRYSDAFEIAQKGS